MSEVYRDNESGLRSRISELEVEVERLKPRPISRKKATPLSGRLIDFLAFVLDLWPVFVMIGVVIGLIFMVAHGINMDRREAKKAMIEYNNSMITGCTVNKIGEHIYIMPVTNAEPTRMLYVYEYDSLKEARADIGNVCPVGKTIGEVWPNDGTNRIQK